MKRLYKRLTALGSGLHTTGGATIPISKTTGSGAYNGIILSKPTAFGAGDNVTITYRDKGGAKPIVSAMSALSLGKMTDLRNATAAPTCDIYVPIGCIALGGDGELDIQVSCASATATGTVYATGVLIQESVFTILQYISYVGSEINNKDFNSLFIMNASSVLTANIEIGFKNGRSEFVSVNELKAASEIFGNGVGTSVDVQYVYQNTLRVPEVDFIKTSDPATSFLYVVSTIDQNKLNMPLVAGAQSITAIVNSNPGAASLARAAIQSERGWIQGLTVQVPASQLD